ncbi:MAG: hypothetical protein Q9M43_09995 [Sulfurimonas sp.]|nr:hypothetical protein [Sulfurimonas sp.]
MLALQREVKQIIEKEVRNDYHFIGGGKGVKCKLFKAKHYRMD